MSDRMFGILGAAWVILGVPLLFLWFSFADDPWATPPFMADLTNPVQAVEALIFYGPPIVLLAMLLRLRLRRTA